MREWVSAELRRPRYRTLWWLNVLVLALALIVMLAIVLPLREQLVANRAAKASQSTSYALYQKLEGEREEILRLQEQLPALAEKQQWQGSSAEFSRAVLDAGTRAGVVLQKELNASRTRDGAQVYSKVLNFDADYDTVKSFLSEVAALEMLVVPSRLVLKPSGDQLAVTLELTAFVEVRE